MSAIAVSHKQTKLQRERLEKRLPLGAPDSGRRYRKDALIGSGGQGDVYLCRDEMLDRDVAVKFLRRDLMGSQDAETNIVREARLMAQMNVPGVPSVHDIDRSLIGCPFFAMSMIRGTNLRQVLHDVRHGAIEATTRYPLERLVDIVRQVADILAAAHQMGIVHSDIKPENIIIDDREVAWLVDWGSATTIDQAQRAPQTTFLGSPAYAAPEQVLGQVTDSRTDIYGLGAVLYDCLALDTLIKAKSRSGAIEDVVHGEHVRPSQCTLRQSVPSILEEICLQAVERHPADRYETAKSFVTALRDGLADLLCHPELETAFEIRVEDQTAMHAMVGS